MSSRDSDSSHAVIATLLFVISAIAAASLLLFAFVVWFAEVLNSYPMALTITGLALGCVATVIYFSTLRPIVHEISEQVATIYAVAKSAQSGYQWVVSQASVWLNLFK